MTIEESNRRQAELETLLYELSKKSLDEQELKEMTARLKNIYCIGFRHQYSKFYPLIIEVFREDNQYNVDYLTTNLDQIRLIVEKDYFETADKKNCLYYGLYQPLVKLADHINLEVGRYNYGLVNQSRLKDLETQNGEMQVRFAAAREELKDAVNQNKQVRAETIVARKKAQRAQKEYVSILGIFAAVVLAFTGGFAFSSSIFDNIAAASIYRIVCVSLIAGMFLFNIIFLLFSFIDKIVNGYSKKTWWQLLIPNVVLILLLLLTFLFWKNGTLESRQKQITESEIYSASEIVEDSAETKPNTPSATE